MTPLFPDLVKIQTVQAIPGCCGCPRNLGSNRYGLLLLLGICWQTATKDYLKGLLY